MDQGDVQAAAPSRGEANSAYANANAGGASAPGNRDRAIEVRNVTLPTGGTFAGMGASFAADAQSGAAGLSIPFPVTAARGLEPALTLTYNSSGGNGLFGQGMSLGLSSVSLSSPKGLPRYDGTDPVSLDGAPLVPSIAAPTSRVVGGRPFTITRYRPRHEGAFTRIEFWQPDDGGCGFWRTLSRDDEVALYGTGPGARVADPADPSRVFEWLIEAQWDAHGNAIRYSYKSEDGQGIPATAAEAGRVQGANRYPRSIAYGNGAPFAPADPLSLPDGPFLFEVLFDYGEYRVAPDNDEPAIPVGEWACRADSFSNYQAGFERRTHRLCRNLLMVHHFPQELGVDSALVKVLALAYDESPHMSVLRSATSQGWRVQADRPSGRRYDVAALPPVTLAWSAAAADPAFQALAVADGTGLPSFGEPPPYALVDLDGCGLPGILYADGKTTSYVAPRLAEPRLDAPLVYGATGFQGFPAGGLAGGRASLSDLDGAGQLALVVASRGVEGFYPMAADGSWENFRPFPHALSDRDAQPAQVLDVTGDGRGDRLRVEAQQVTVNVNLGREGYAPALRRARDNLLPLTTLPQAGETVRAADVLGGGTAPIVELRDGSIRCWPNLGHGRFGAPVDVPAPILPSSVRTERVVLADLFGSGCADMVVAYTDRLAIYRNRAGNGFSQQPVIVELPAPLASIAQLRTADVAGSGCQALVFTSDEPAPRHWVCALAGDTRPWMLTEVDNGTGQLTRISYASSARYQLLDRLQGRDWVTSLASPMQVVARVEHVDQVGGVSRVVEYHYSHGYYDPEERLFRGFGLVETRNADAPFATALQRVGDGNAVHVREWYHTGALLAAETLEDAFAREYWHGDPDAFPMPPSCFDWQGAAPDARTWREAVAALAGTVLRREVYGLDDPLAPYSVEDFNATVRLEQPRMGEHEAVFLKLARESAKSLYDRDAADPRVQHQATLEVDQWGDVTLACDVAYGRRPTVAGATAEQLKTWFSAERTEFLAAREAPDLWLAGLPGQVRHWNLPNPPKPTVRGLYFDFQALVAAVGAAIAPGGGATLLSWDRTVYKGDGGGETAASPPMPQALVVRQETAAFDAAELRPLFTGAEPPGGLDAFLAAQGYRWEPETALWWNPGSSAEYLGADGFYAPSAVRDVFAQAGGARAGTVVRYTYDPHALILASTTSSSTGKDSADMVEQALTVDYRHVAVVARKDVNERIDETLLDPLGRVVATSFRGWDWKDGAAVATGFDPLPLADPAQWPVPADTDALLADPARYLGGAASIFFLDWDCWRAKGEPTHNVAVRATAYPGGTAEQVPTIEITFADGFGRTLQAKLRSDEGQAFSAKAMLESAAERWITSGGVHYNGIGLPDRQYEPYFTDHWSYTADPGLNALGAALTLHYDPLGRRVRTDHPKGGMPAAFFELQVHHPWSEAHWDQDDTIKASDYYRAHVDPGGGAAIPPEEKAALVAAALFDGTPTIEHLDARGLPLVNQATLTGQDVAPSVLAEQIRHDAAGRIVRVADPRLAAKGLWNVVTAYALDGQVVRTDSVDAGTQWMLADALGAKVYSRDGRGVSVVTAFDGRHRAVATQVYGQGADAPAIVERVIYGDSLDAAGRTPVAAPESRNLMGVPYMVFDGAGRLEVPARSLTGGVAAETRRLATAYAALPDWQGAQAPADWAALLASLDPLLAAESFTTVTRHDALARVTGQTDPGGNEVTVAYKRDGFVGALAARGQTYLSAVDYNAKGQRQRAVFAGATGDLLRTDYRYDPDTFRMVGLTTTRLADGVKLQDLSYWTDPVGNVTAITDASAPGVNTFHANQQVSADQAFTYDSLYRLIANQGRARVSYSASMAADGGYTPYLAAQPGDGCAQERYGMSYDYDDGGNLFQTRYSAAGGKWTKTLTREDGSNRAADTGGGSLDGWFDAAGNQLKLPNGPTLAWSWANRLASAVLVARDGNEPDAEYYGYDSSGVRLRKVVRRLVGGAMAGEEVITLGNWSVTRRLQGDGKVASEYRTSRLMDKARCVVELTDWTVGSPTEGVSAHQARHQLDTLLNSAVMEVADDGRIISYEEYSPYGCTVYAAGSSLAEVSLKRYRYCGRERDKATGLYYYGARYYAPWLARWLSADPAGLIDGPNLYAFVGGNPVSHEDIGGFARSKKTNWSGRRKKKKLTDVDKSYKKQKRKDKVPGVQRGPNSITKQNKTTRQRKDYGTREKSSRLKAVMEAKTAKIDLPDQAVGHAYSGQEVAMGVFGSYHSLHVDINSKLEQDLQSFLKGTTALTGIPKSIADYAAEKHSSGGDFLESLTQTTAQGVTRPYLSSAKITNRNGQDEKDGAATPHGGIDSTYDDKGHLVPEKGVSFNHSTKVNSPNNVVPENWVVNQQYKTTFENFMKNLSGSHSVSTVHVPIYANDNSARPESIQHYGAINGKIFTAFTFANPTFIAHRNR